MKQSNIIFLLFSLSITACIYAVFGNSISKSEVINTVPVLNNYVATDAHNININVIYYPDNQPTITTTHASTDESHDAAKTDNPHLPVAYKIKSRPANSEFELEEGQSRTFLYASSGVNIANVEDNDAHENSNDGYFLQPGQSRTFLATPEQNDYVDDEELLLH